MEVECPDPPLHDNATDTLPKDQRVSQVVNRTFSGRAGGLYNEYKYYPVPSFFFLCVLLITVLVFYDNIKERPGVFLL